MIGVQTQEPGGSPKDSRDYSKYVHFHSLFMMSQYLFSLLD